jgi:predicted nucleotide-binding protein (sugar kinase/HSP70/actin superfamily)
VGPWVTFSESQLKCAPACLTRGSLFFLTKLEKTADCARAPEIVTSTQEVSVSEVTTVTKEKFTMTELNALRNDLRQQRMLDSCEAAEFLRVFLMGRGYGVSPQAALDAASRVEISGCSLPVLERELEGLALVM